MLGRALRFAAVIAAGGAPYPALRCASTDARAFAPVGGLRGLPVAGNADILIPGQRELVIDRLLALDVEDLTLDQVRWVVLMVLSSQPGQE
jgi:hypothetical protein